MIFRKLKKKLAKTVEGDVIYGTATMKLPKSGLYPHVRYYHPEGELDISEDIPIQLVVIYNVEQLAVEIVKRLKDGTNDSGYGNDDSNNSPVPF